MTGSCKINMKKECRGVNIFYIIGTVIQVMNWSDDCQDGLLCTYCLEDVFNDFDYKTSVPLTHLATL